MDFSEAKQYLLRRRRLGVKLGLHNMARAMEALHHPEGSFPTVLVAGSKGKGSVCAFLESILLAAGHEVGLYTSPHLVGVRERIRVGGVPVGEEEFVRLLTSLRRLLSRRVPALTYFEWLTVMALRHFRDRRVPLAVLEVGMGGRLDATNVVPAGTAIVTEIEKEHTESLGSTLALVAREKAGIVKKGTELLSGATPASACREIARVAREQGVRPRRLEDEAEWSVTSHTRRGVKVNLSTSAREYRGLHLGLLGRHQARNAALAVLAAESLDRKGFKIGVGDVRAGLACARWPGRCDYRPGRPPLFLDGAHTPSSVRALVEALDDLFPGRPRTLIFGVLRDKKIATLADLLFPGSREVVLVRPPEERGMATGEMVRRLPPRWRRLCRAAGDTAFALDMARRSAGSRGLVVVAGSLFLVGDVLRLLHPDRSVAQ
jgi:dihydrofolate synthase/folylpolyglutamate synthase